MRENHALWSDKLEDALWAIRTAFQTPVGCTPYSLVIGNACHLLLKLEHKAFWALKHTNFDLKTAGNHRKLQLNELSKLCDQAYENSLIYKERAKKLHDVKIKNRIFNVRDQVLLFNSRLKIFSGKLKSHWSGPFIISEIYPYETAKLNHSDRGIDFESGEIENFLNDDSIPFGVEDYPFNMDEDILFLESLLREDPIPPHPIIPNQTKLSIEEPKHSFKMGYEHFNTNLVTKDVAESSTKNLIPIPHECESDYFDEFYGPFIPIHILEEERIRREHADYINRMEMLFTINPQPHPPTNDNTNVESFSSFVIQESNFRQEEIDVVSITDDVLPPSVDNSDEEVDAVDVLRVDNLIQNSEHEYSESEDSNFDNPPIPLPPPEPPDKGFDFEIKISVVRSVIVKFECIDARVKFDVFNDENDVLSYFMFVIFAKELSLLSAENEDTIFDPGISE
nr:reverse transcriptase domain-containing protein [Tanacetum cinerariifolium]